MATSSSKNTSWVRVNPTVFYKRASAGTAAFVVMTGTNRRLAKATYYLTPRRQSQGATNDPVQTPTPWTLARFSAST